MALAISLKEFTVTYPGSTVPALNKVNLEIAKGEKVGVIGKSGSGKSTMLKCFNGIVPQIIPADMGGTIAIDGISTEQMQPYDLSAKVGLVFEDPETQIVAPTVAEDITFGPINLGLPKDEVLKRLEYGLDVSRLRDCVRRTPSGLSGGQKQSLVIGGILAMFPSVLALDEPLTGLDPKGKERVAQILGEYIRSKQDATMVISEGGTNIDVLLGLVDRLVVMNKGSIVYDGTVDGVLSNHDLFEKGVVSYPQVTELGYNLRVPITPRTVDDLVPYAKSMVLQRSEYWRSKKEREVSKKREPLITVTNLYHVYPPAVKALDGVSMSVCDGEFLALIGQNGSGKTTLAYHIAGLLKPSKELGGTIQIGGQDLYKMSVPELRKYVGYVFQNPRDQFFAETVEEEIAYSLIMRGTPREEALAEARNLAKTYHIENLLNLTVPQLSRAEASVVSLFSIAITRPKVLIVDEPAGGSDESESWRIYSDLKSLNASGMAIVVITHDMRRVFEFAERVLVMNSGKVLSEGDPITVFKQTDLLAQAWIKPPAISDLEQKLEKETGISIPARSARELGSLLRGDAA